MALNLHLVRCFAAVVDHGGVVAASRALNVSQPAISRAVHALEAQLGTALLERRPSGGRRSRPTAAGRALALHARVIFDAERSAEATLAALQGVQTGRLTVGASPTIAAYLMPAIVARFVRAFPGITVQLEAAPTREIVRRLLRFDLDVAFAEAPVRDSRLRVTAWREDEMIAVAAPTHPLAGKRRISASRLSEGTMLLREPATRTHALVRSALVSVGAEPRRVLTVEGVEPLRALAREGVGVAVLSRAAVQADVDAGVLVELDVHPAFHVRRTFARVSVRGRPPSPAVRAFLQVVREG
jgi:DNA-binding transcriptional LysR family regulator